MSKKKKILIFATIMLIIIITILQVSRINLKIYMKEKKIEYVKNIDYDIKMYYEERFPKPTGYASQNTYYLINIDKKIKYKIDDYYVFGVEEDESKKGHNYTVTKSKISKEEIDKLIKYVEEPNEIDKPNNLINGYWVIEYKGKKVEMK